MSALTLSQLIVKQQTTTALKDCIKARKKSAKEEHNLQVSIVQFLRYQGYIVFAIANGGSRNVVEAVNLKKEGVLAGVADLQVILKDGRSIFLELKTAKGKQSQSQIDFENNLKELGHNYYVIRSIDEVINILDKFRNISKNSMKYSICNICHTPTIQEEVGDDGICKYCR